LCAGFQPTVAKIFVNKCNFGFDDVDSSEPAQILMLNPSDLDKGARIPLRAVRFTAVRSLHVSDWVVLLRAPNGFCDRPAAFTVPLLQIFFDNDEEDAESSELSALAVFGSTVAGTNVSELKKC
jgi:PITH domain